MRKSLVLVFAAFSVLAGCSSYKAQTIASDKTPVTGIIGGTETQADSPIARSVVGLANMNREDICTGTLIDSDLILTAAHCLEGSPEDTVVVFGSDFDSRDRVLRAVSAYLIHPDFPEHQNDKFNQNDIALVRFDGGLPRGYRPVRPLKKGGLLQEGTEVVIAGYGLENDRRQTGMGRLRESNQVRVDSLKTALTEVVLDVAEGGACLGDSGGPGFVMDGDELLLWGVFSRTHSPNGRCSEFSIYTRVSAHKTWIAKSIDELRAKRVKAPRPPDPRIRFFR